MDKGTRMSQLTESVESHQKSIDAISNCLDEIQAALVPSLEIEESKDKNKWQEKVLLHIYQSPSRLSSQDSCEKILIVEYNTPEHQRILMASFHTEEALVWIQDKEELGLFMSWEAFVKALQTQLGSVAYDDKMEALTRLRQISAVANYKEQFKALFNQIKGLSKGHKLSCFLSGLKDGSVATC